MERRRDGGVVMRMGQKGVYRLFFLALVGSLLMGSAGYVFCAEPMRTIVDRTGRAVKIPVNPKRIACFLGPSYEKTLLLGSADKVVMTAINQPPWSYKIRPAATKNSLMDLQISYNDPDVERLLAAGIDLVFYWQWPRQTEKMLAAGIPVVCPLQRKVLPTTLDEYIQNTKDEIAFYGEVLGEKAKKIAAAYTDYYDRKMKRVLTRTSKIPAERRPKVYFVTGRTVLSTQGKNSVAYWAVEAAGGTLVSQETEQYQVEASMEQIISWNPDVIVIGALAPLHLVHDDPRWKGIKAVREKRVYSSPEGVFVWSHGSSESFLLVMWLAKTLHPDKFRDLDVVEEVREYYKKFYHYPLTDKEARRILAHQPPK